MLPVVEDGDIRLKLVQLKELAERGTITNIAKQLQHIQKDLRQSKINLNEALKQVVDMANRYNDYYRDSQQADEESAATIILSESFQ